MRPQHVGDEALDLAEQHHAHLQEGRHPENEEGRARALIGQQQVERGGQRLGAEHRVDGDLERHRPQQSERRGQQIDQEDPDDVWPMRLHLSQQPPMHSEIRPPNSHRVSSTIWPCVNTCVPAVRSGTSRMAPSETGRRPTGRAATTDAALPDAGPRLRTRPRPENGERPRRGRESKAEPPVVVLTLNSSCSHAGSRSSRGAEARRDGDADGSMQRRREAGRTAEERLSPPARGTVSAAPRQVPWVRITCPETDRGWCASRIASPTERG